MTAPDLLALAARTDHIDGDGVNAELEERLARFTGFRYAVTVCNASTALDAAYDAAGFIRGDEVIAPAYTVAEPITPLLWRGCRVVFADINEETLTLDPETVRQCITPRTKGIVGVDIAGWPQPDEELRSIAEEHGLFYVADVAQGFGARSNDHHSGVNAHAAVMSLNAQKAYLQAGEGGVLLTNDNDHVYRKVVCATQHPHRQALEFGRDNVNYFGRNGRLSALASAAALHNFPSAIESINNQRTQARALIAALNQLKLTTPITIPNHLEPTFPYLSVAWDGTPQPAILLAALHEAGLDVHLRNMPLRPLHQLPQLHEQFAAQVRITQPLTNTEQAAQRICIHFGGEQ